MNPPPCTCVVLLAGRLMYRHMACMNFFDIEFVNQFVIGDRFVKTIQDLKYVIFSTAIV